MRESVIYQDILQRGRQQEALSFCMHLLNQRFSEVDSSVIEQVRVLSVEQLEALGGAVLNITEMADLVAWLEQR